MSKKKRTSHFCRSLLTYLGPQKGCYEPFSTSTFLPSVTQKKQKTRCTWYVKYIPGTIYILRLYVLKKLIFTKSEGRKYYTNVRQQEKKGRVSRAISWAFSEHYVGPPQDTLPSPPFDLLRPTPVVFFSSYSTRTYGVPTWKPLCKQLRSALSCLMCAQSATVRLPFWRLTTSSGGSFSPIVANSCRNVRRCCFFVSRLSCARRGGGGGGGGGVVGDGSVVGCCCWWCW